MILPEPSLRRLPWYLAHVKLLMENSVEFVSSTQIAAATNVDASQVAKDLSMLEISGKTRVGYEVASLVEVLEDFLGFTKCH
ncbi:MAG: redox-sensing transcriptional repressor Rex, partial [Coprobacter sp.]|nr:redox-sensing transcriptional repressor Rex [Coprobacter sp.]